MYARSLISTSEHVLSSLLSLSSFLFCFICSCIFLSSFSVCHFSAAEPIKPLEGFVFVFSLWLHPDVRNLQRMEASRDKFGLFRPFMGDNTWTCAASVRSLGTGSRLELNAAAASDKSSYTWLGPGMRVASRSLGLDLEWE